LKSIAIGDLCVPVRDNDVVARHIEKVSDVNVHRRYLKGRKLLKLALIKGAHGFLAGVRAADAGHITGMH
jgi:hypothetical protein